MIRARKWTDESRLNDQKVELANQTIAANDRKGQTTLSCDNRKLGKCTRKLKLTLCMSSRKSLKLPSSGIADFPLQQFALFSFSNSQQLPGLQQSQ